MGTRSGPPGGKHTARLARVGGDAQRVSAAAARRCSEAGGRRRRKPEMRRALEVLRQAHPHTGPLDQGMSIKKLADLGPFRLSRKHGRIPCAVGA